MDEVKIPHIFGAIHAIQTAISKTGIAKSRQNVQQGYKFRGIDDIMNELATLFAEHKIFTVPEVLDCETKDMPTKSGGLLFYSTITVKFTVISVVDGTSVMGTLKGRAMDTGDKDVNKAVSAALKYFYIILFCIPTEGDNDADATTHDTVVATKPKKETDVSKPEKAKADTTDFDPLKEKVDFGKYRGTLWIDLEIGYLQWLMNQSTDPDKTSKAARVLEILHRSAPQEEDPFKDLFPPSEKAQA